MQKLLPLSTKERKHLFKRTSSTPVVVEALLRGLSQQKLLQKPDKSFSLHEHIWHLADLESVAVGPRIKALLEQDTPLLADFPGDEVAMRRNYHTLPLQEAFATFSHARLQNLWILSGVGPADWMRRGEQEGVGIVSLVDIFRAMAVHDDDHVTDIKKILAGDSVAQSSSNVAA